MVVGDRETDQIDHFSPLKKRLQALGSAVVRRASGTESRTRPRASAPTTARPRCRWSSSRSSPTRSRRSSRPARRWSRSTTSRSGPTTRRASRGCSRRCGPTSAATARRSSAIYALYEPLRVFMIAAAIVGAAGRGHLGPLPLVLLQRRGRGPRPVADPRVDPAGDRRPVRGARRDGRHPRRAAHAAAAHARAGPPRRAPARRRAVALRARARAGRAARRPEPGRARRRARPPSARRWRREPDRGDPRVDRAPTEVPTGNTFDKYGSTNPVVRRLMAGFHAHARRAVGPGRARARSSTSAAARACSPTSGRSGSATAGSSGIDLDDAKLRARVGPAQPAQPRVPRRGGHPALVRRRRVRRRDRDRGARARARPRGDRRRDGARRAAAPARLGAARAALARAEHGPRRVRARSRQHARAREPLVQARLHGRCSRVTARSSRRARRSRGRCCSSACSDASRASGRPRVRARGGGPVGPDRHHRA